MEISLTLAFWLFALLFAAFCAYIYLVTRYLVLDTDPDEIHFVRTPRWGEAVATSLSSERRARLPRTGAHVSRSRHESLFVRLRRQPLPGTSLA